MLSLVDGHTLAEIEREEEDEYESEAAQSDITEKDNVCSLNNNIIYHNAGFISEDRGAWGGVVLFVPPPPPGN